MKKKFIALAMVVIMVLGTVAGTLIGCDIITTNAEKDYKQVVATVQYGGLSDVVLKGELRTIYNSYGPMYVQYYGMTEEEALEYLFDSLARQSLLLLKAKADLAKEMGVTSFGNDSDITDLLTDDEIRYCIQRANAEFKSQWEANIEERENEQAANDNADEETPSDEEETDEELEARPVREEQEPSTDYVDQGFVEDEEHAFPAVFSEWYNEQIAQVQKEIDELNEQIANAGDADTSELEAKLDEARTKRSNMRSAYTDLLNSLTDNYTDYDYFLNAQYESRIAEKYEELLGKELTVSDPEVAEYIKVIGKTNVEELLDEDAYASAVEGGTIVRHYAKGYFNVRSILLGFTEEQKTYLTSLTDRLGEDNVDVFRAVVALGTAGIDAGYTGIDTSSSVVEDIVARWGDKGIGINISNTEYDASTDALKDAYTARNVNYADVLAAMVKYISASTSEFLATAQSVMGEEYAANESVLKQYAIGEAFTDLMYLVNDDDGMFESESYQVTPDGTATSYVEEYAVLARRLYKESERDTRAEIGKMAVSESNRGDLMISGTTSDALFNNDAFPEAAGVQYSIYVSEMTSTIADGKKIDAPVYTFVTEEGSISFIINTYGIQIVMINGYAFDETQIGSTVSSEVDEAGHTWYVLGDDYGYQTVVTVNYKVDDDFSYALDENDEKIIESITVERKTLKESFRESMLDGKRSDSYNTAINKFVSENEDACVTLNEKVYQGLLSELTQA